MLYGNNATFDTVKVTSASLQYKPVQEMHTSEKYIRYFQAWTLTPPTVTLQNVTYSIAELQAHNLGR
jgi:hypothetical protein